MPSLDPQALARQVKAGRLSAVHVFAGEDVKQMDAMIEAIEATIDPADQPFAVERLYAGEDRGHPIDIAAAAQVYPMLGDRRLVIVLRAEKLLKPKRAAKADASGRDGGLLDSESDADVDQAEPIDTAPLEDYLASPSPTTTLLFVASGLDRGRRFTKKLIEMATITIFAGLAEDGATKGRDARPAALRLIEEEVARAGRQIDPAAARVLVDRSGGDVTKLRADVERVLIYTEGQPRISAEDVTDTVITEAVVDDEWAVVNAIAAGNVAMAVREVGRRLDRGDAVFQVLGQLRWWVSTRLAESDPGRVRPAIDALLRTDLALKSSGGDERVLIERLVVELTGRPVAARGGWR